MLVTIVIQEEVLNRGYVALNLRGLWIIGSYPDIHDDIRAHSFPHQSRQCLSTYQLGCEWTGFDNLLFVEWINLGAGHFALCH